jgi:hypothetical protein
MHSTATAWLIFWKKAFWLIFFVVSISEPEVTSEQKRRAEERWSQAMSQLLTHLLVDTLSNRRASSVV